MTTLPKPGDKIRIISSIRKNFGCSGFQSLWDAGQREFTVVSGGYPMTISFAGPGSPILNERRFTNGTIEWEYVKVGRSLPKPGDTIRIAPGNKQEFGCMDFQRLWNAGQREFTVKRLKVPGAPVFEGHGDPLINLERYTNGDIKWEYVKEKPTVRNPFEKGDRVVLNGFRNSRDGLGSYHYGDNPTMERWGREKTVLTVTIRDIRYAAVSDGDYDFAFHPSELRMATREEIQAADKPRLVVGTVIRLENPWRVAVVKGKNPDSDGDLPVFCVIDGSVEWVKAGGNHEVLGRLTDDGWEPAQ